MQLRTRSALLESLVEELQAKTSEFLGTGIGTVMGMCAGVGVGAGSGTGISGPLYTNNFPVSPTSSDASGTATSSSGGSGNRFIDTVRKALISRVRNASTESVPQHFSKKSQLEPSPPSNRQSTSSSKLGKLRNQIELSSPVGSPDLTSRRDVDSGTDCKPVAPERPELASRSSEAVPEKSVSSTYSTSTFQRLTRENLRRREEPEPTTRVAQFESDDSSLNSELDCDQAVYPDSDTGLESMSSAEVHEAAAAAAATAATATTVATASRPTKDGTNDAHPHADADVDAEDTGVDAEALRTQVTRLKCDKLDLLRQNVVSSYICRLASYINVRSIKKRRIYRPVRANMNSFISDRQRFDDKVVVSVRTERQVYFYCLCDVVDQFETMRNNTMVLSVLH